MINEIFNAHPGLIKLFVLPLVVVFVLAVFSLEALVIKRASLAIGVIRKNVRAAKRKKRERQRRRK